MALEKQNALKRDPVLDLKCTFTQEPSLWGRFHERPQDLAHCQAEPLAEI